MAGTDKVDTHGHTKDMAVAEYPDLDVTDGNAASQVTPTGDAMVLAQTPAEVTAQIENVPGEDEA